MKQAYSHILSPIRIGNTLFRNRIFAGPTELHAMRNGEPYPSEEAISHFANRARAGAACVTCVGVNILPFEPDRNIGYWDIYHTTSINRLAQLATTSFSAAIYLIFCSTKSIHSSN